MTTFLIIGGSFLALLAVVALLMRYDRFDEPLRDCVTLSMLEPTDDPPLSDAVVPEWRINWSPKESFDAND